MITWTLTTLGVTGRWETAETNEIPEIPETSVSERADQKIELTQIKESDGTGKYWGTKLNTKNLKKNQGNTENQHNKTQNCKY